MSDFLSPASATGPRPPRVYGHGHRQIRRVWAVKVALGGVECARCGKPIEPGELFDLDHRDDGFGYLGASHASCNRSTNRRTTSRKW